MERGQRARESSWATLASSAPDGFDHGTDERPPRAGCPDDEHRTTETVVPAVRRPREHERRARSGRQKAPPLPAEILAPVPSTPVVIVIRAGAGQIVPPPEDR